MWEYSKKLLDHFYHPRNQGAIDDANGVGEVGSIACGDAMKLYLKVSDDGIIDDAKFETFGCGSAVASASALTELIKGKPVDEAIKLTNDDIAEYLEGIPKEKMHCSVMGREALEAAINNYKGISVKETHSDEGKIVCKCFGITDEKIKRVALENNLHSVEEITNYTKAGGGCGSCIPQIEDLLKEIWTCEDNRQVVKKAKPPIIKGTMTNIQKINLIQETIEHEIRPSLHKDGGDIDLIDVDGNKVIVALRGACTECKAADFTLKGLVEAKLKEFVADDLEVVVAQ
jgi:NifU-like protein